MKYDTAVFSADGNHLALARDGDKGDGELALMSKSADGCWLEAGGIGLGFGEWQLAFSPDSRHLIAWFECIGEHFEIKYYADYGRTNFFVMLFSLDDQGLWVEKQRITKHTSELKAKYPLKAEFSPDGKHLAICAKFHYEVWTLKGQNRTFINLDEKMGVSFFPPFFLSSMPGVPKNSRARLWQNGIWQNRTSIISKVRRSK